MKQTHWRLMRRFSRGSVGYFLGAVLASLCLTILNACSPQVFRYTIDSVLGDAASALPDWANRLAEAAGGPAYLREHLWILAGVIILIALLAGLSIYFLRVNTALAGENFARNIRNALFAHVQRIAMSWHDRNKTGDIIQRCTSDVDVIRNFAVQQLLDVFRTAFLIVVSFTMMFSMNRRLSLIVLIFIPIIVAYTTVFFGMIRKQFLVADEAEGELSTLVQENATGVRVVRAFGRESYELEKFDKKNNHFANLWIKVGTVSGLYWGVGDIITGLQVVTVIVLGAYAAAQGNMTVGEFVAFATYNSNLIWPIRRLGRIFSDMSKAGVSFDRVSYILEAEEEEKRQAPAQEPASMDIVFSHVNFSYDEEHPILKDVSFEAPAGRTIGILGGTGSGKSTVIQLLERLYEIEDGTITIGGVDIRELPKSWIRSHVGIVLQEPFLFSRSIRENIAAGRPEATLEEIREAARIACIDDAIMEFPDGYDTLVGERGVTLSGGQRQRVAIARMILQNTPVMIFDDSLSAVDSETDSRIRKALKAFRGNMTILIISHRVTTLMGADEILVMHRGRITERGTHEELAAGHGIYRQIYDIQMSQDDRRFLEEGGEDDGSL
ncbi:MAG: ABC transporter ATP-binding protein [Lachnospiraceae bacterium]|nr:ABC transporter ATP-binding protein [Lachnospiraceae bacterium]